MIVKPKKVYKSFERSPVYDLSFENVHNFLLEDGVVVHNCDTFQSYDLLQQLSAHNFNTQIISVDKLTDKICKPYQYFKSAIYENRIQMYENKLLTEEIIGLERNNNSGKVDHTPTGINCFTGDTKIRLVDGRSLSILNLKNEFENGKVNFVYSFNHETQRIEPRQISNVFKSGHNATLVEVTLDNGEKIHCTPEHKFMLRDGTYCEAKNLHENQSLMPLYTKLSSKGLKGYRLFYEPMTEDWHYEHRAFCNEVLDEKYLVHHKDCNKLNNNPSNLIYCSRSAHQQIHAKIQYQETVSKAVSENHKKGKYKNAYIALQKCNEERRGKPRPKEVIEKMKKTRSEHGPYEISEETRKKWSEATKRKRWYHNGETSIYIDKDAPVPEGYVPGRIKTWKNHKVVSVKYLSYVEDVYDVTIDGTHNFALDAGVFVHNSKDQADAVCGALWNASNHAEEFDFEFGDRIDTMIDVSSEVSPEMQQKQLTIDFENELKKVQSDFSNSMSLPNVGEDYYFANDIIII